MNYITKENFLKNKYIFLIFFFFIIRFFQYSFFDLGLNGINYGYHTPDKFFLLNDLKNSILYQHSQPFLYSLYHGILLKISFGDEKIVEKIFLFFNIILSLGILIYFFKILEFFNINFKINFLIFIFFSLWPTILFYENLFTYHQILTFLFTQASFYIFKLFKEKKFKYELFIYFDIILMSWIWAAITPVLLIVVFIALQFFVKNFSLKKLILFTIILSLCLIPSIKNKIIFGTISASSWSGHGFSTTFNPEWLEFCGHPLDDQKKYEKKYFLQYKKKFQHPYLVGERSRFNNIGLIVKSNECFTKTLSKIKNEPERYFFTRLMAIIATHGKFPFDFVPQPINFNKIYNSQFVNDNYKFLRQIVLLLINTFIYIFIIYNLLFLEVNRKLKASILIIILMYAYLFSVSFLFSCCEQERMLYHGYVKLIIFFGLMYKKFNNFWLRG